MISFGIDIGTTTTRATAVEISFTPWGEKRIDLLPNSTLCVFTPYEGSSIEEAQILKTLNKWSQELPKPDVGTLLFTGEAQRAPNSQTLGRNILNNWPEFLSYQLNPYTESRLAALGAHVFEKSKLDLGRSYIHIDIGGGTSNFAWIENGELIDTACLDIGCRKWILDKEKKVSQLSKTGIFLAPTVKVGQGITPEILAEQLTKPLLDFLNSEVPKELVVAPWAKPLKLNRPHVSISGGIVECWNEPDPYRYGDLGPSFAKSLKKSLESKKIPYSLSEAEGRATALGVSAFSFSVSGNSIHMPEDPWHLKNIPLVLEAELERDAPLASVLAVFLQDLTTENLEIEKRAKSLLKKIPRKKGKTILVLMEPNLAKTLHFYLKNSDFEIYTLDKIQLPQETLLGIKTLDLKPEKEGRYLVAIKSLKTF